MAEIRILIADDEESLRAALRIMLEEAGYTVFEAGTGVATLALFEREEPDLVILDIMMPMMDGFEVCGILRRISPFVPILFLSAKSGISDKRQGFHLGADDYLTKPFSQEELLLHVEALLRRARLTPTDQDVCTDAGSLHIDRSRCEVTVEGRPIALTPMEFRIIAVLAQTPGKVFSRDEITEKVWGADYHGIEIGIPTHIRHIREKIEDDPAEPRHLQTVGRFGYRLAD